MYSIKLTHEDYSNYDWQVYAEQINDDELDNYYGTLAQMALDEWDYRVESEFIKSKRDHHTLHDCCKIGHEYLGVCCERHSCIDDIAEDNPCNCQIEEVSESSLLESMLNNVFDEESFQEKTGHSLENINYGTVQTAVNDLRS